MFYSYVSLPECSPKLVLLKEEPFAAGEICETSIKMRNYPYEPRKKPSYFPLYWFVNRDPYNGLL